MGKRKKTSRFEGYEIVEMPDVVTFGTSLFIRHDKKVLKIVFPTGTVCTFAPEEDKQILKDKLK